MDHLALRGSLLCCGLRDRCDVKKTVTEITGAQNAHPFKVLKNIDPVSISCVGFLLRNSNFLDQVVE